MIFELNDEQAGDWDRFQVRKIGFRAQRRKVTHFTELLDLKGGVALRRSCSLNCSSESSAEETTYLKSTAESPAASSRRSLSSVRYADLDFTRMNTDRSGVRGSLLQKNSRVY